MKNEWLMVTRSIGPALLALSVYLYFVYQSTESFSSGFASIFLFAGGSYLFLSDVKVLRSFERILPFFIFGVAASLILVTYDTAAIVSSSDYAQALAFVASRLTALILSAAGVSVVVSNDVLLFHNGMALSVGPLCSGAYSTILFLLVSLVMVVDLGRNAPRRRLAIALALGVVGANLANVIRITFLASVMYLFGLDALSVVHQFAGYAVFLAFMSLFWLLSLRWLAPKKDWSGAQPR